jgi:hypothetical protein
MSLPRTGPFVTEDVDPPALEVVVVTDRVCGGLDVDVELPPHALTVSNRAMRPPHAARRRDPIPRGRTSVQ